MITLQELLLQHLNPATILYKDLLKTAEWAEKRQIILTRDLGVCQKCGKGPTESEYDQNLQCVLHYWLVFIPSTDESTSKLIIGNQEVEVGNGVTAYDFSSKPYHMEVHHRCYVRKRYPWQYDNDQLITLCNWCHWDLHQNEQVPLYLEDGKTLCNSDPCQRCSGAGHLPQYSHVDGGTCFWCHGSGYQDNLL